MRYRSEVRERVSNSGSERSPAARRISERALSNGALEVRHVIRYGEAECLAFYTVLPGTCPRTRERHIESITRAYVARLKYDKQQVAAAQATVSHRFYERILPKIERLRAQGYSLAAVAARLNEDGEVTRTGLSWSGSLVNSALKTQRLPKGVSDGSCMHGLGGEELVDERDHHAALSDA
jgi:hypothetical protein